MLEKRKTLKTGFNPISGALVIILLTVEKAMEGIKDCFKINCNQPFRRNGPCLNFSLGLCLGMCIGSPAAIDQYKQIVTKIGMFLQGIDTSLSREINQRMELAADDFQFEAAAKYRNYLDSLAFLLKKEKVIEFTEKDHDIVILEPLLNNECKLFLISRTEVLFKEKLSFINEEHLKNHIKACISKFFKTSSPRPVQKVCRDQLDEAQIIYSYLQSGKCRYFIFPTEENINVDNFYLDEAVGSLLNGILIKNSQYTV